MNLINTKKYSNYSDTNYSYIDDFKNINVDPSQLNLTQEINSQFIPFEMPRFYDGIDLMEMNLLIHYINPEEESSTTIPVNVSYSDDKIRFCWLVDGLATSIAGEVKFEVIAYGTNEKAEKYVWKSKPNGRLQIESSLSGNGVLPEGEPGYLDFLEQVTQEVIKSKASASSASMSAKEAEESVLEIERTIENLKQDVMQDVQGNLDNIVDDKLTNYYTKPEVDSIADDILPEELNGGFYVEDT